MILTQRHLHRRGRRGRGGQHARERQKQAEEAAAGGTHTRHRSAGNCTAERPAAWDCAGVMRLRAATAARVRRPGFTHTCHHTAISAPLPSAEAGRSVRARLPSGARSRSPRAGGRENSGRGSGATNTQLAAMRDRALSKDTCAFPGCLWTIAAALRAARLVRFFLLGKHA